MGVLDRIRSSLGMGQSIKGPGQRLGDNKPGNEVPASTTVPGVVNSDESTTFDVIFEEMTLGIQFSHPLDESGKPNTAAVRTLVVHDIVTNGEADKKAVRKGDEIISVDGNDVKSYDEFVMMVKALERPLTVQFRRLLPKPPSSDSGFHVWRRDNEPPSNVFTLTQQEKEDRRAAMKAAADSRAGAWDKKVKASARKREEDSKNKGSSGGIYSHPEAASVGDQNPVTQRAAKMAQHSEKAQAAEMGYNPFVPQMSMSMKTSSTESATEDAAQSGQGKVSLEDEDEEAFTLALGMLLSSEVAEAQVAACVTTISKLLGNLCTSNGAEKFRRLKRGNAAIQNRILNVPGGEALLLAAGFVDSEEGGELVFVHKFDSKSAALAEYTLDRLKQLL